MTAAADFGALHHGVGPFLLPNAWDVASAVLLAAAGHPAIGTTSLGITAAAGLPDGAGAGRALTLALAGVLVRRLAVPLTVDLEGGYSEDPGEVAALAGELAELGVAGVNLEDGMPGGGLRPIEQHAAVIKAVSEAVPSLFVNARTDTYWLGSHPAEDRLCETVRRLSAYRDAGAAGVFAPGLTDLRDIAYLVDTVARPLNVLWSPAAEPGALAAVGVARISTGSGLYRHALGAALGVAAAARTGEQPATVPVDYQHLQRLLAGEPGQVLG